MKCERCFERAAEYRVSSDVLDMKVCSNCAAEARPLKLAVQLLHPDKTRSDTGNRGPKQRAA
jgi:protein-arginine kinase activator protein McsA